jgi:hypothetical protein
MDLAKTYGDIAETLLEYVENHRTDQAQDILRIPARSYLDRGQFEREMALIFKRLPLMLALSIELPKANDYKAMDVIGLPVLIRLILHQRGDEHRGLDRRVGHRAHHRSDDVFAG